MTFLQQNLLWKSHPAPEIKCRIWTTFQKRPLFLLWTPSNPVYFQFGNLHLGNKLWLDGVLYATRRAQAARQKCPPTFFFFSYLLFSLSQVSAAMYLRVNFTPVGKKNLLWTFLPSVRSVSKSFTSAVLNPSAVKHMDNFMDWAISLNG